MKKIDFNENWFFKRLNEGTDGELITLPHDAMCRERRSQKSSGRHNVGWFESYDYEYTKKYFVPAQYKTKTLMLEFEGVYHNAEVYVNGEKLCFRPYGYTNFYVELDGHLKYGQENEIRVIARNADQPNSRWYSGSGIYRPVWLYEADEQHVLVNGVQIRTVSRTPACVEVEVKTSLAGDAQIEILDASGKSVAKKAVQTRILDSSKSKNAVAQVQMDIQDAKLWSCENPYLYTCVVRCGTDEARERFGIRTLTWTAQNGISINGAHVILRGACIHHDNGVLGACAFPEAEERKIRLLKENGYNAVRCAHNPCSKALLDACDRLGMLVMDEYVDMWYIHKTEYDYASYMQDWWQQDLKDMVEKDMNHPSVIMYSTGNEVAETAQKKGIELTDKMTKYLHALDSTRPVTCGINIFFNFLSSMGFGIYSDEKAKKDAEKYLPENKKKKKTVGSEFYNTMAGYFGDTVMKVGATLHMCDVKTRDAYAAMDVAGYNYGVFRYKHDLKKYPERLIVGSETFCKDAYRFYELAKREKRLVGDFVWAGMDYIGEAGIGAWEYEDYAPAKGEETGWLTAGSGRINILGYPNGEALYTKVAFERSKGPFIAVKPVYQSGKHSPSAWKLTDALPSWSYSGCEGTKAEVEVYARAKYARLFINGKCVGQKNFNNDCRVVFKTIYDSGEITAVSYDAKGNELGRKTLKTAGKVTWLSILPEAASVKPQGLSFIQLRYTDASGIWKPMEKHNLKINVENGTLLGFGNACAYNPEGYWKDTTKTYFGEALAVVRAGDGGEVKITVTDETGDHAAVIPINQ